MANARPRGAFFFNNLNMIVENGGSHTLCRVSAEAVADEEGDREKCGEVLHAEHVANTTTDRLIGQRD